jgi:hypothetical protein
MKETTRAQIEAMKAQTIGVEIEMHSITRQSAAKAKTTHVTDIAPKTFKRCTLLALE